MSRRPRALLSDLDRTLTGPDLLLDARVPVAFERLRRGGVAPIVITGRPLDHVLASPLREAAVAIVAENGALLHLDGEEYVDSEIDTFRDRACEALGPLASSFTWGRILGSGPRKLAHEARALVEKAGIACDLSFNAEEVMLLPSGIHKGRGARRVLDRLGIEPAEAVAIGDGDNDVELFRSVAAGYAVANASPAACQAATRVMAAPYADGFLELAGELLTG